MWGSPSLAYFHEDWRLGVLLLEKRYRREYWFIKDWRCSELRFKIEDFFQNMWISQIRIDLNMEISLPYFEDLTIFFEEIEDSDMCREPQCAISNVSLMYDRWYNDNDTIVFMFCLWYRFTAINTMAWKAAAWMHVREICNQIVAYG